MNVEKIQKEVTVLLKSRGVEVKGDPLAEFIMDDKNAHPILFFPDRLPDGELCFGAGCLIESDDVEVFAVVDDSDKLIALATVIEDNAEVWMNETGKWEQVEGL